MVKRLMSIQKVDESQVFQTGYEPLLVYATDFQYYVCKYNTSNVTANMLFREWMNAHFLKIWELNVPDFCLIDLKPNHKPDSKPNIKHQIPLFGSLYDSQNREVDEFISGMPQSQKGKFRQKNDLLKLAIFDLWTSNEDRSHNNYNLLLKYSGGQIDFVPIDGGNLFHTGNQDKENFSLSYEESLISSPLMRVLFSGRELSNRENIALLQENYYFCISKCKEQLYEIIQGTPKEWLINNQLEFNRLGNFLFKESWLTDVFNTFLSHLQHLANSK